MCKMLNGSLKADLRNCLRNIVDVKDVAQRRDDSLGWVTDHFLHLVIAFLHGVKQQTLPGE